MEGCGVIPLIGGVCPYVPKFKEFFLLLNAIGGKWEQEYYFGLE
jgi:hypothetical protein